MQNRAEGYYEAFKAKDARFDGRFFVGITTTGIYCRPVCRARLPAAKHCVFFQTAAQAEKAGYRPCLLCRPELAPGLAAVDAQAALANRAARYIEENCAQDAGIEALAAQLGYTGRHLRRAFQAQYHVSPVQYRQTCRLLLAKSLLTDTALPVSAVAMAAGFGSLRRFNEVFRRQYRLPPTGFRKVGKAAPGTGGAVTVAIGYKAPYCWQQLLGFLAARAIPGVEVVANNTYSRTVHIEKDGKQFLGWLTVADRPAKNVLAVTMSDSLLPVLPQVLGRVRSLFDTYCDPEAVAEKLAGDAALPAAAYGLRVPGCFDAFELCTRAVLGQQITVKAAGTLAGRLALALGQPIKTEVPGLTVVFPPAEALLRPEEEIAETLGALGIIAARTKAIYALAQLFAAPPAGFGGNPAADVQRLQGIRGIGPWTASYIAMRAFGDTDIFLETDLGIRKAMGGKSPKEMRAMAEKWRPWRSYATMALWEALGKEEQK